MAGEAGKDADHYTTTTTPTLMEIVPEYMTVASII